MPLTHHLPLYSGLMVSPKPSKLHHIPSVFPLSNRVAGMYGGDKGVTPLFIKCNFKKDVLIAQSACFPDWLRFHLAIWQAKSITFLFS